MAYNKRRWGSDSWTIRLKQMGQEVGATFSNWKYWPSTLKSHRLIMFLKERGVPTSTSNAALFHALYEEGKNISVNETLVEIALTVTTFLESTEGKREVFQEIDQGRRQFGFSGVPFFIINNKSNENIPTGLSNVYTTTIYIYNFFFHLHSIEYLMNVEFVIFIHYICLSGAQSVETFLQVFEEI
eukprot:GSMAST32.ASY1.ANO1.1813.1 assembled CDS